MTHSTQQLRDWARRTYTGLPPVFVLVDVARQQLTLFDGDAAQRTYPVSTSRIGTGSEIDSLRTPTGKHRVAERIGESAPLGAVFEARNDTGRVWRGEHLDDDLILTRILRLAGLEEGHNRGPGVDSFDRLIYIHGTNHESEIGSPASHGCVRMRNADVADLFELVSEGTLVIIR